MDIEETIFGKMEIDYNKLKDYGFVMENNIYKFSKQFMNNSFRAEISITNNGKIIGKVYDVEFGDEYVNFRIEDSVGEFVGKVREEYENILKDIAEKCCERQYFHFKQANRITNLIIKKYGNIPEFLWESIPDYGVFRNQNNNKWYGIIMNIPRNKVDVGQKQVEIIDLKLEENRIQELLGQKGFYKSYHMNKKSWIAIILDDTLSDEEIMKIIDESYKTIDTPDEWIVPANPKYYDVINCFNDTDTIIWKQSNNIKNGDIIYLYVAAPYSAIIYQCSVLEVNIPYEYKDKNVSMQKVMKIKLLKRYNKEEYTFEKLNEYGIKAIRGPRSIPKNLSKDLKEVR